jgi:DNA helicase MCM8
MRQLESLIRLTEARAKMELREEATEADAIDVVEIMRASMVDTAADEGGMGGKMDFSRSANGAGMSSRGASKKFIRALEQEAEVVGKNRYTMIRLQPKYCCN